MTTRIVGVMVMRRLNVAKMEVHYADGSVRSLDRQDGHEDAFEREVEHWRQAYRNQEPRP